MMEKESLLRELAQAKLLCRATHCNADIYSVDGGSAPAIMAEVCRLRKESYRRVGVVLDDGVSGGDADRDGTYRQLLVWDRERCAIVGGYRYAVGRAVDVERLSLTRYMNLSENFVRGHLPRCIELGRSFISPHYSSGANALTIYALDALWEGLAQVVKRESAEYLVGRVTLYDSLGVDARNLLVGYMQHASPIEEQLMVARSPFEVGISRQKFNEIFIGNTHLDNYKILRSQIRQMGQQIPPIISSYLRLSPSLKLFDSYMNYELGGVVESAIMLTISEFYDSVKSRYSI